MGRRKSGNPQWVCPTCLKGVLKIEPDSFRFEETRDSKRAHGDEAWDPDWIKYVYSCTLVCSFDNCKEMVSSSGVGFVEPDFYYDESGEAQQGWDDFFRPKYFFPPLKLFRYPPNTADLKAGNGEFGTAEEFYTFWRKFPFKIGRAVQKQLDKLLAQ